MQKRDIDALKASNFIHPIDGSPPVFADPDATPQELFQSSAFANYRGRVGLAQGQAGQGAFGRVGNVAG